jgi:thiol:disulfide interchange protein
VVAFATSKPCLPNPSEPVDMKHLPALLTAALLAMGIPFVSAAAPSPSASQVVWHGAAANADIDRAFAQASSTAKPLLLYWGATWCPPCNQLKATLFNRQDFAALSKSFVAVHIDGDKPGAGAAAPGPGRRPAGA